MKKQKNEVISSPTAHICMQKRVKVYDTDNSPTYYLAKGDTFSIELYNPTNKTVLAKIRLKW
jgi:hypothetical protein